MLLQAQPVVVSQARPPGSGWVEPVSQFSAPGWWACCRTDDHCHSTLGWGRLGRAGCVAKAKKTGRGV